MKSKIVVETKPVWIKFYKDKLIFITNKINHLEKDDRFYWKKLNILLEERDRVEVRLGLKKIK